MARDAPDPAGAPLSAERLVALQQSAGNHAVTRIIRQGGGPRAARPLVARTDQHAGTGELSSRQLRAIENEIYPAAAPVGSGAARDWDGRSGGPGAWSARRDELRTELLAAMGRHLDRVMPGIRRQADPAQTPRTTVASMAGAGEAAKRQVDAVFGDYASAAALTGPQQHLRSSFAMTPGTHLVDRTAPAFGTDVDDLGNWIAATDRAAQRAARRHAFVETRSAEEADWLRDHVVADFVALRGADLDLYDRYGFFDTTRRRISILPTLTAGGPMTGSGGAPPPRLRHQQWANWQLLIHEYIHTLEHPAFEHAHGGNRILFEGFCEYFALQVKRHWVPIARADGDLALRMEIEGADAHGRPWPGFDPSWIDTPNAGEYAPYVRHTIAIRNRIGAGGEAALRAAFFQGHVELIGLQPSGDMQSAPVHLNDDIHVPAGIPDRAALAAASGVPEAEIAAANPALAAPRSAVRFGQSVRLVGCREHVIVQARPTDDAPTGSPVIETPAQIARQHGITEAVLRRANPGVNWATLRPGDHILIPRH